MRFSKFNLLNPRRTSCLHFNLNQKLKYRFDQILIEIEIIMRHLGGEDHERLSLTPFL